MKFKLPRMSEWLIIALLLLILIALISPQQLGITLYKMSLVSLAAVVAYWIDRSAFPYARPDSYLCAVDWQGYRRTFGTSACDADLAVSPGYHMVFALAMLRRAIIMGACMLGVCLGL